MQHFGGLVSQPPEKLAHSTFSVTEQWRSELLLVNPNVETYFKIKSWREMCWNGGKKMCMD